MKRDYANLVNCDKETNVVFVEVAVEVDGEVDGEVAGYGRVFFETSRTARGPGTLSDS